ncbi:MAG: hypothetical protein K6G33_08620 [Ruminococcus sp.]|uniref:hypothetical protein n=1 Tax=Ruminococcus sp. TaxID=41978 RepID=UPI002A081F63|nr:hypothetical protein [Ruminococcus sp.]
MDKIQNEEGYLRYDYFQPFDEPETVLLIDLRFSANTSVSELKNIEENLSEERFSSQPVHKAPLRATQRG